MSMIDSTKMPAQAEPLDPLPVYLDVRATFAERFLFGEGLEIGALHQPLAIPSHARARYVDRMRSEELRQEYPELTDWNLTEVSIVDDGEQLTTIPAESQDFIIANHFLEHTENPIGTIENHLGKLKPGGILFYAVPDKRFTFDFKRQPTPLNHMVADYEEGPERSRHQHYTEWARWVEEGSGPPGQAEEQRIERRAQVLEDAKYSIHMHVWTQAEFLELILDMRKRFDEAFDIEAAARTGIEFVVVLRKRGPLPTPPPPPAPPGATPGRVRFERWKFRARRILSAARNKVRRWRARS
ncbi:MAG: methyltransferase domain-containing protein [Solirubrobacterales bacterium]